MFAQSLRAVTIAVAIALVASGSLTPIAAADNSPIEIGDTGIDSGEIAIGEDDGGLVNSTTSATNTTEPIASVIKNTTTSQIPSDTKAPTNRSIPGGLGIPAGTVPDVPLDGNSSGPGGSLPSNQSAPLDSVPTNGSIPLETSTDLQPDSGAAEASIVSENNQPVGTTINCDLSSGWLRLCTARNTVPTKPSDLPYDRLPAIPDQVNAVSPIPVSWGVVFLAADSGVNQPNSVVGVAISQGSTIVPTQSPVDPANPPYNPSNPPINLADPAGSLDPSLRRTGSGVPQSGGNWESIRAVETNLSDRIGLFLVGGGAQANGTRYIGGAVGGTDGQNQYQGAVEIADDGRLRIDKSGFINGNATFTQDKQQGGLAIDLGGKRYGSQFGGGSGSVPSLPVDPSQPPSLPVPADQ